MALYRRKALHLQTRELCTVTCVSSSTSGVTGLQVSSAWRRITHSCFCVCPLDACATRLEPVDRNGEQFDECSLAASILNSRLSSYHMFLLALQEL
mmetsp:Transcript_48030/g.127191  ORF Transcript_48030/g.127191 Transcript_48030/m.127191 type:complete len:96 (-) Transcript_48030:208-495(-)